MCVHVHMHACVVCVDMYEESRSSHCVFLDKSLWLFVFFCFVFETCLSLNLELIDWLD